MCRECDVHHVERTKRVTLTIWKEPRDVMFTMWKELRE